jgi:hypothetical protein
MLADQIIRVLVKYFPDLDQSRKSEGFFGATWGTDSGRTQGILIQVLDAVVFISTPVSPKETVSLTDLVEASQYFGVVSLGPSWGLRHVVLTANLTEDGLLDNIRFVSNVADSLEEKLSGGSDQF